MRPRPTLRLQCILAIQLQTEISGKMACCGRPVQRATRESQKSKDSYFWLEGSSTLWRGILLSRSRRGPAALRRRVQRARGDDTFVKPIYDVSVLPRHVSCQESLQSRPRESPFLSARPEQPTPKVEFADESLAPRVSSVWILCSKQLTRKR